MKTAFTYYDTRIASVFDDAGQIYIIDHDDGEIRSEKDEHIREQWPIQKAVRLVQWEIDTLVCGAISRQLYRMLIAYGVKVVPFVSGDLHAVIQSWITGEDIREKYSMPGVHSWGRSWPTETEASDTTSGRGRRNRGCGRRAGIGRNSAKTFTNGPHAFDEGFCVCPQCGYRTPHQRGIPCVEQTCPECGSGMTREKHTT